MNTPDVDPVRGIALVCGRDGVIQSVIHDDLGLLEDAVGRNLLAIVGTASEEKAAAFIAEVASDGAAFDWELSVRIEGLARLVHFAGATTSPDAVVVVGATSRSGVMRFYDDLMRLNNEQANALRAAIKLRTGAKVVERDAGVYEQLSQLNNDLATVQRELTKKNIALERANKLKNQFMGMAAHDLRNPIGAIRSYASLLLDDEVEITPERRRIFLERIRGSSQFMLALIDDLLDLSAIEAGQLRVDVRQVDIARLVRENVEVNAMLAAEKEIVIGLDVADDIPLVVADPHKIEQVLNNLISNAIKFSPPETVVHVAVFRDVDYVVLTVADQGPGIPAAEVLEIFKPFRRATPRATRGEHSTGLGLAIAKRVVDAHGGELTCETEVGRGTTFRASLLIAGPSRPFSSS